MHLVLFTGAEIKTMLCCKVVFKRAALTDKFLEVNVCKIKRLVYKIGRFFDEIFLETCKILSVIALRN